MENKKLIKKNILATIGGLLTSLSVASVIDWDSFSFDNPAHIIKLLVTVLPAIGGWVSTIK